MHHSFSREDELIREPEFRSGQHAREPVRILLLEDDPLFADLLQMQLRRMPWVQSRLETVRRLDEALARLAAESFGLVVTDLNLPDSSGVQTVEALARTCEQPIIVLTGDSDPRMHEAAARAGAYEVLSKDGLSAAALERLVRLAWIQASTRRSLRESESRFRSVIELSSDWYWEQDADLRFTRFEGASPERVPGNRPQLAMGKRRWEMPGHIPLSGSWDEHRATLEARRPFRDFQFSRITEDGELRYVSASGVPVFDPDGTFRGYRGIATEITARKHAEEELRRFRLALDTSPDMILLIDRASMRHLDVNTTACQLLGYSRDELLAMGPQDIVALSREELERLYDDMIANAASVTGTRSVYRCKDGSRLPFESTRRVLRSDGHWVIAVISRDIRSRIAAEEAQRASEERFRSLTALSSDWYWEQDAQFRLTYMSNIEKTGLDPASYLGRLRWDQPALNLTQEDWTRHRAQLERHEPFRDFEIERPAPGGGSRWISLSGEPVFDAERRFTGYRGVGRDITARKQSEKEVLRLGRINAALGQANEAVLRARSPQEVFERACDVGVAAGGFQLVSVFGLDASSGRLSRLAASGVAAPLLRDVVPQIDASQPGGGGVLGRACRSREPAISNDYADAQVTGYQVRSAAAFPLLVEGELIGVLGLLHAERNVFSDELTGLLQRLADNICFALENFSREARRNNAQRGLRESEARFRSLTELSDLYWEQDEEYRFTRLLGVAPKWLEAGRQQMLGLRRWDANYFNMTDAAWSAHRADLDARRAFRDLELGRLSEAGEKVWVSVSGEPVFDDAGAFRGYRGIGKDITARKRADQLRELEHSVTRSLAEAQSIDGALRGAIRAVCETEGWECGRYFAPDAESGVLQLAAAWGVENEAVQRFLEGSRDVTYAKGVGLSGGVWESGEPLWVSDALTDSRSAHRDLARATGMRGAFVFPVIAEGITIGALGFNSRVVRKPDDALMQAIRVIGSQIGQFVQRKQAEDVMRESEARFRSLTRLSSDWYWEQDAELRFVGTSGSSDARGGITPQAHIGMQRWELPGTQIIGQTWEQHRAVLEARQPFRDVILRRTAGGEVRYVSVAGEPVFDAQQKFAGYRGVATDITDKRRGEEALRRFRYAVDATADGIHIVDCESMRLIDVNETACRYLGYGREELLALELAEIAPGLAREKLKRIYEALFAGPDVVQRDEIAHRRKDGTLIPIEITRRGVLIEGRRLAVNVVRDITERKRAEERQAAHLRYQERIARFGQSALVKREPGELVAQAVQAVLEALAADAVAFLDVEAGKELVLRALVGVAAPGAQSGGIVCAPGSPLYEAMQSGTRVLAEGASLPFSWSRELGSVALVPVRGGDRVRGVLCVCYRQPAAFAAEELNFVDAAASVLSTALQRIDSEGRLAYLAQFDPLTGLPNRALLADRFSQMIVQAKRRSSPLAVLFIDLDEFKMVNDTLGHAGGDALLKEAAVRLQSSVRSGDTVARISGDEFAVVLADLARAEDAALVAQKILERLAAAFEVLGNETFVTASIGIAGFPGDGADAETLIGAADAAMYRAKQSGRNAYQFFTADINQRSRARAQMGVELRRALEREEFVLHYQPKVNLSDRKVGGAEALLRWNHPERGLVSPAEFIPVLEETGLIVAAGEWVLRRACADLKAWGRKLRVSINLSARQFRRQDLDQRLKALVAEADVDPGLIELEITESQLMHDPDHAIRVVRALRDAGMRIAIDDFGTGYSSLAYLTRFPAEALKIDRSFVRSMTTDKSDATIVRTIIDLAHTLGLTVVAEGVEQEEQANFLRLLRCEQAQGYLFARPMPVADFMRFCEAPGRL